MAHGAILTNETRRYRHLTHDHLCPLCGMEAESVLHALRDCNRNLDIWSVLVDPNKWEVFLQCNLHDWLLQNLRKELGRSKDDSWRLIFALVIDTFWFTRNQFVFENTVTEGNLLLRLHTRVRECKSVFTVLSPLTTPHKGCSSIKVCWSPPSDGWIKLNSDDSVRDGNGIASCGGILRDENGIFLAAFASNLWACTIMQAELSGILHGIHLARRRNVAKLLIESDSNNAIQLLDSACDSTHPCALILHDIKELIKDFPCVKWSHTYREANQCADILANHGHSLVWGVHLFNQVPPFLSLAIFADLVGTPFDRAL